MNNAELIKSIKEYKDFKDRLLNMIAAGLFDKDIDFEKSKERVVKCVEFLLRGDLTNE